MTHKDLPHPVDLLILLGITAFLLSYFKPELMLSRTVTTGGDTASHYYSAYFMKNVLLPEGRLIGWTQGNYAGFPLFQFYFFLPFLLIAALGYVMPLQIAFKIITVLGTFLLPPAIYTAMRRMNFKHPIPAYAAIFSLPFLFMEANSMWGGNIPSTLAGEFSYSLSLVFTLLYMGLLYREITKEGDKRYHHLVGLLVLITFTHVYTLFLVVASSAFFLIKIDRDRLTENLMFLGKVYSIAFLLTAFWAVPMVWKLSYTTPFAVVWDIKGLKEVFPPILTPFYILSVFGLYRALKKGDEGILYLTFTILTAAFLYALAPSLEIVDIRFIPFIQLFPLLLAAYGLGEFTGRLNAQWLLSIIVLLATVIWVGQNITFIPNWIQWNYEGFEGKAPWSSYQGVNDFLKGGEGDPRVVYEHSSLHNSAGTPRAFESLPLFAGRNTLEGLYMQSSITSPFIFYIQSEISQVTSCPFPQWPCASFNPIDAARHLAMFNVKWVIARTEETKAALRQSPLYRLAKSIGPYEVYEVVVNQDRYVTVPGYEPILYNTESWKEVSFLWFIDPELLDRPLVFPEGRHIIEGRFKQVKSFEELKSMEKSPINGDCLISEVVSHEEIRFSTSCPGVPHLIRVSYFPNWKVEGADRVYLASPSFMLVYPSQEQVRIYYGRTNIDLIGLFLTVMGIVIILSERWWSPVLNRLDLKGRISLTLQFIEAHKLRVILAALILVSAAYVGYYEHGLERQRQDDLFGMDLATATGKYTVCNNRVKNTDLKELCYEKVGIMTNDYNLCDVRINNQSLRDRCFYEIGLQTRDLNLCRVKILSPELKEECAKALG